LVTACWRVVIASRNLQHDYGVLVAGEIRTYQPGVPSLSGLDRTPGYDLAAPLAARLADAIGDISLPPVSAAVTGDVARSPVVALGTILSGDTFINCDATRIRQHMAFKAAAVEMEGGAVAQVCRRLGDVPFINVRCLSDLAGATSHLASAHPPWRRWQPW
jgi:adenosylhomocysteine nucleosidase